VGNFVDHWVHSVRMVRGWDLGAGWRWREACRPELSNPSAMWKSLWAPLTQM
jgi:hypothetical protein